MLITSLASLIFEAYYGMRMREMSHAPCREMQSGGVIHPTMCYSRGSGSAFAKVLLPAVFQT